MRLKFFVFLFLGLSLVFFQCESSPTSSHDDDEEPIENPGGGGVDQGPEVYPLFLDKDIEYTPYQRFFAAGDMQMESKGYPYGEYPMVIDTDTVMVFVDDAINYNLIGDILGIDFIGQEIYIDEVLTMSLPLVEPGEYKIQVIISDDYVFEAEINVGTFEPITNPISVTQEVVTDLAIQFDNLSNVTFENPDLEYDFQSDLIRLEELKLVFEQKLETATEEEIEELAYFIRGNKDMLTSNFSGKINYQKMADACLASTPEEALELIFKDIKEKVNFTGFLQIFKDTQDPNDVEVSEPSLFDSFISWTNTGKSLSVISSLLDSAKCLFQLVIDNGIQADLDEIGSKSKLKAASVDTLLIEAGGTYRLSFSGIYEQKDDYSTDDFGYDEFWLPLVRIKIAIEKSSFVQSFWYLTRSEPDTVVRKIHSKHLELASDISDIKERFGFNIEPDLSSGDFIISVSSSDDPFLLEDRSFPFAYKPYSTYDYEEEIDQVMTISTCPDFSALIPGKWESVFYTYDDLAEIFQIDQIEFLEDGTWRKKDYFLVDQWYQHENYVTGTWRSSCEDGEAWFYYTDDFFGVTWSFEYVGDKNRMLGYRWVYDTTYNYDGPTQVLRKAEF